MGESKGSMVSALCRICRYVESHIGGIYTLNVRLGGAADDNSASHALFWLGKLTNKSEEID